MPRKRRQSENPPPPQSATPPTPAPGPTPSILDAFKTPTPEPFQPITLPDPMPVAAPSVAEPDPNLSGILDKIEVVPPEPTTLPLPSRPALTALPRPVEILFDIALEVKENDKTSIPVRLDAAEAIITWLDRVGSTQPHVPRTDALRTFLSHVAEYKVRCEPRERVRAAALLLELG